MNNTPDRAAGILATSPSHPIMYDNQNNFNIISLFYYFWKDPSSTNTMAQRGGRPNNLDIAENFTRINSQRTWMS